MLLANTMMQYQVFAIRAKSVRPGACCILFAFAVIEHRGKTKKDDEMVMTYGIAELSLDP